jgi:hypothetical protein
MITPLIAYGPDLFESEPESNFLCSYRSPFENNTLDYIENTWAIRSTGYKGTILSDKYNGLYFFKDNAIDYYTKSYNFENFGNIESFEHDLEFDPLELVRVQIGVSGQVNRHLYINNHPALLERKELARSLVVSIGNSPTMHSYYPSVKYIL